MMKKKFLYIGIGLFVAAMITFALSQSLIGVQSPSLQTDNFTTGAGNFSYTGVNISAVGGIFALIKSSAPLNVYLFNGSAFQQWKSAMAVDRENGGAKAISLEGRGAVIIYENSTLVSIPPVANSTGVTPAYDAGSSNSTFSPGEYYFVMDNSKGSSSSNTVVSSRIIFVPTLNSKEEAALKGGHLPGFIVDAAIEGGVMLLLFIGGIVSLVYGIISKEKTDGEETEKISKEIDDLYKNVGKPKRKNARKRSSDEK